MLGSRWPLAKLKEAASLSWVLVLTFCLGSSPSGAESSLPAAENLAQEARQSAQSGYPLVILYTRPRCPYCERVKKDHLLPLSRDARFAGAVIRQIDQTSPQALIDFAGNATTQKAYAASRKIKLVPVVAFYGPNGEDLAPTIVGARIADYYQGDLEEAIGVAQRKLSAR